MLSWYASCYCRLPMTTRGCWMIPNLWCSSSTSMTTGWNTSCACTYACWSTATPPLMKPTARSTGCSPNMALKSRPGRWMSICSTVRAGSSWSAAARSDRHRLRGHRGETHNSAFPRHRARTMPKAAELKKGQIVQINNQPYIVSQIDVKSPSSRSGTTLYKVRFNHVQTGQKLEQSLTGDDVLTPIDFQKRAIQFLYQDADGYTFMDNEDFTQFTLSPDALEDQIPYLYDGIQGLYGLVVEGNLIGVELPAVVEMPIAETPPAIKGSSASARTKTARFASGLEIQIPEYLETGEVVRINTETGKYMSRA